MVLCGCQYVQKYLTAYTCRLARETLPLTWCISCSLLTLVAHSVEYSSGYGAAVVHQCSPSSGCATSYSFRSAAALQGKVLTILGGKVGLLELDYCSPQLVSVGIVRYRPPIPPCGGCGLLGMREKLPCWSMVEAMDATTGNACTCR
jgi:hypothetical protein